MEAISMLSCRLLFHYSVVLDTSELQSKETLLDFVYRLSTRPKSSLLSLLALLSLGALLVSKSTFILSLPLMGKKLQSLELPEFHLPWPIPSLPIKLQSPPPLLVRSTLLCLPFILIIVLSSAASVSGDQQVEPMVAIPQIPSPVGAHTLTHLMRLRVAHMLPKLASARTEAERAQLESLHGALVEALSTVQSSESNDKLIQVVLARDESILLALERDLGEALEASHQDGYAHYL